MISDEIKLKLLKAYECQFVGILLQHGVADYIDAPANFRVKKTSTHRFDNIKLDPNKMSSILGGDVQIVGEENLLPTPANSEEDLSEENLIEFVKKYRHLFPKPRRGTIGVVLKKLKKFLQEEGKLYSLDTIYNVTKNYVEVTMVKSGADYVRSANNIIYKKITGGTDMLLLNLLESEDNRDSFAIDSSDSSAISGSLNLDDLDNYKDDLDD